MAPVHALAVAALAVAAAAAVVQADAGPGVAAAETVGAQADEARSVPACQYAVRPPRINARIDGAKPKSCPRRLRSPA